MSHHRLLIGVLLLAQGVWGRAGAADTLRVMTYNLMYFGASTTDLPESILRRKKAGFAMPVAAWLQQDLKSWALDLSQSSLVASTGILDPAAVHRIKEWKLKPPDQKKYTTKLT